MSGETILKTLLGRWEGTCRTWFEPGKLADESAVGGEFTSVLDGKFVRHKYSGHLQEKPREGEELLALNSVTGRYQVTWIDSFHMNYAIMMSDGPASDDPSTDNGFAVAGKYDVGEGHPPWGWRTEYQTVGASSLLITAFNISPAGEETKAIETRYERIT